MRYICSFLAGLFAVSVAGHADERIIGKSDGTDIVTVRVGAQEAS